MFLSHSQKRNRNVRTIDKRHEDVDTKYEAGTLLDKGNKIVRGQWCIICRYILIEISMKHHIQNSLLF